MNYVSTLIENALTREIWVYLWTFSSIPLTHMSLFMAVPHYFDHCSFTVSFEIWKYEYSKLFFFFKIVSKFSYTWQYTLLLHITYTLPNVLFPCKKREQTTCVFSYLSMVSWDISAQNPLSSHSQLYFRFHFSSLINTNVLCITLTLLLFCGQGKINV